MMMTGKSMLSKRLVLKSTVVYFLKHETLISYGFYLKIQEYQIQIYKRLVYIYTI